MNTMRTLRGEQSAGQTGSIHQPTGPFSGIWKEEVGAKLSPVHAWKKLEKCLKGEERGGSAPASNRWGWRARARARMRDDS